MLAPNIFIGVPVVDCSGFPGGIDTCVWSPCISMALFVVSTVVVGQYCHRFFSQWVSKPVPFSLLG